LNTFTKNTFLLLLLSTAFILHACGGSNQIKSQKNAESILKSYTPVATPPMVAMTATATVSVNQTPSVNGSFPNHTYTNKSAGTKHHTALHPINQPIIAVITPLAVSSPTPIATAISFATTTEPAPKKPSSHWPLIIAGLALAAALGFYFWTKKAPPHNDFPLPPMGGLSPVGGFTGMKSKVKQETKKQSLWNKKLF
jgi:hypothetical protein